MVTVITPDSWEAENKESISRNQGYFGLYNETLSKKHMTPLTYTML